MSFGEILGLNDPDSACVGLTIIIPFDACLTKSIAWCTNKLILYLHLFLEIFHRKYPGEEVSS